MAQIRLEAEPLEVLEDRELILRSATASVMVLEAQEDAASERPGNSPDVNGVDDMTEV